jgi:probable rRNA maturation factor
LKSGQVAREVSLTVVITNDVRIRELNRTFRDVDTPTDVLSFSNIADKAAVPGMDDSYLGDVVISYERAGEQAAALGHSVEEEIALLVVHGVLHLLGYDHEEPGNKRRMWSVQDDALEALGIAWRP